MTLRGRGAQGWSEREVDSGFQDCGDKFCCFGDLRGRPGETGPTGDSGRGHEPPSAALSKPTRPVAPQVSATQDQPWAGGGHPAGHSPRSGTARPPAPAPWPLTFGSVSLRAEDRSVHQGLWEKRGGLGRRHFSPGRNL